jgi:hypothetical protein
MTRISRSDGGGFEQTASAPTHYVLVLINGSAISELRYDLGQ